MIVLSRAKLCFLFTSFRSVWPLRWMPTAWELCRGILASSTSEVAIFHPDRNFSQHAPLNNRDYRDQHHTVQWPPCLPHRIPRPWTVHDQISLIRTACCEIIELWKTHGIPKPYISGQNIIIYQILSNKNSIRIDYLTTVRNGPDKGWPFLASRPLGTHRLWPLEGRYPHPRGIRFMVAIGAQNQDAWPWRQLGDKTRHAASQDSQNTVTVDELGRSSHYCMFDVWL